jgi:hypothetical protein
MRRPSIIRGRKRRWVPKVHMPREADEPKAEIHVESNHCADPCRNLWIWLGHMMWTPRAYKTHQDRENDAKLLTPNRRPSSSPIISSNSRAKLAPTQTFAINKKNALFDGPSWFEVLGFPHIFKTEHRNIVWFFDAIVCVFEEYIENLLWIVVNHHSIFVVTYLLHTQWRLLCTKNFNQHGWLRFTSGSIC